MKYYLSTSYLFIVLLWSHWIQGPGTFNTVLETDVPPVSYLPLRKLRLVVGIGLGNLPKDRTRKSLTVTRSRWTRTRSPDKLVHQGPLGPDTLHNQRFFVARTPDRRSDSGSPRGPTGGRRDWCRTGRRSATGVFRRLFL